VKRQDVTGHTRRCCRSRSSQSSTRFSACIALHASEPAPAHSDLHCARPHGAAHLILDLPRLFAHAAAAAPREWVQTRGAPPWLSATSRGASCRLILMSRSRTGSREARPASRAPRHASARHLATLFLRPVVAASPERRAASARIAERINAGTSRASSRGPILDRNGQVLVSTRLRWAVQIWSS